MIFRLMVALLLGAGLTARLIHRAFSPLISFKGDDK